MIIADNITCEMPSDKSILVECSLPEAGFLEWLTAFGTVGAVIVAVVFGVLAWRNEKRAEKDAEILREKEAGERLIEGRRQNHENQFVQVVNMMREMVNLFPFGNKENQLWFQSKHGAYIRYLAYDDEQELAGLATQILQLFTLINHTYSSETNAQAQLYSADIWAVNANVVKAKGLLLMLATQFEVFLQAWHRTREDKNFAIDGLTVLLETVQQAFDEIDVEKE